MPVGHFAEWMTGFKVTIILQHFPAESHMHKTVIFIPEDPKVGVGAVIWAKRQSVSFLPFALICLFFCFLSLVQNYQRFLFCSKLDQINPFMGDCIMHQGFQCGWMQFAVLKLIAVEKTLFFSFHAMIITACKLSRYCMWVHPLQYSLHFLLISV